MARVPGIRRPRPRFTEMEGSLRHPCVGCYREDTETGLALKGEAEFLMVMLMQFGLPQLDSGELVRSLARDGYGCDPGYVPKDDMTMLLRICDDCVAKAHEKLREQLRTAPIGDADTLGADGIPLYVQPEETRERWELRFEEMTERALDASWRVDWGRLN